MRSRGAFGSCQRQASQFCSGIPGGRYFCCGVKVNVLNWLNSAVRVRQQLTQRRRSVPRILITV
jgi:hypothetical protein